jgi:hypothetical protein
MVLNNFKKVGRKGMVLGLFGYEIVSWMDGIRCNSSHADHADCFLCILFR